MEIRPYREADAGALLVIMNQIVRRGDAFVYDEPLDPPAMRRWVEMYSRTFVAEHDGRVLGAYLLRPNFPGRGKHVCNAAYLVAEEARGLGVGRAMGEHSLVTATSLGYTAMQFNAVVSTNEPAVALWRSLGFSVVGTIPEAFRHADGRAVDLHIMHRIL